MRERDRALGEALEHQVVERAVLGELDRRIEAVAGEARAAAKSQRRAHERVGASRYSGSMPAFLMMFFHFSDSAAWNLPSSAGEVTKGSVPVLL